MNKLLIGAASGMFLTSCGSSNVSTPPTIPTPVLAERPAGTPDYYVVGISGKCITGEQGFVGDCAQLSRSSINPQDTSLNYNYLVPRGTLPAIANAIADKGWKTVYRGYAASLQDRTNNSSGVMETHPGFVTLANDLISIYNGSIKGFRNPSRIVLVAHSHGVVWAHLLSVLYPEIPVEIEVDFDGVCLYWQSDNEGDFKAIGQGNIIDFESMCRSRDALLGGNPTDIQNVTQNNVRYNIEIQSKVLMNALRDGTNNTRPDGTSTGIFTSRFNENHSGVTLKGSAGLTHAIRQVETLTPRK